MAFERHLKGCSLSKFPQPCLALGVVIFHHWSLKEGVILGLSLKSKYKNIWWEMGNINTLVHNNTSGILGVRQASWCPGYAGRVMLRSYSCLYRGYLPLPALHLSRHRIPLFLWRTIPLLIFVLGTSVSMWPRLSQPKHCILLATVIGSRIRMWLESSQ